MSNPESFIEEVTEEVRRDKLFAALKKYGWIGVVGIIVIVGGTSINEWMKAQQQAAAEAAGDAILAADALADPAARLDALDAIVAEGDVSALVGLIAASDQTDPVAASDRLAAIAADSSLPQLYRDLAAFKRATVADSPLSVDDRVAALEPLTVPGGAFRVLAEEQIALAEVEQGKTEAAIERLQALMIDTEASQGLRQRVSRLIVSLGATPQETPGGNG